MNNAGIDLAEKLSWLFTVDGVGGGASVTG
jgi:hypothetical protein